MDYAKLTATFRSAFDNIELQNAPGFLPRFPRGCCGWAALFMGNYLRQSFDVSPLHVFASHPSGEYGHEWIEVDENVFDITLDQFREDLPIAHYGALLSFHDDLEVGEKLSPQQLTDFENIHNEGQVPIPELYSHFASFVKARWKGPVRQ